MTNPDDPNLFATRAIDRLLGEPTGGESPGDPRGSAETARLLRLFAAEAQAFAVPDDPSAPARVTVRVLDRIRAEDARDARQARQRRTLVRWAWVLGAAVAAHVAVLAFVVPSRSGGAEGPQVPAFETVASVPGAASLDAADLARGEAALEAPGAYRLDDRLAVERVRIDDAPVEVRIPAPASPSATFAPGAARVMAVRASDPLKRAIEARVGGAGSLDLVKRGLAALAARQTLDGSFDPPDEVSRTATTALVALAFLGDGQSSAAGVHRGVVERAVTFLRATRHRDPSTPASAYELAAVAEDFLAASGSWTPAETRARAAELANLAARVRAEGAAAGPAEARRMALDAAVRAGVAAPDSAAAVPVVAVTPEDPHEAAWMGASLLRQGHGNEFRAWAAASAVRARGQFAADGLVRGTETSRPADRVAETALLLLALQVPYRVF